MFLKWNVVKFPTNSSGGITVADEVTTKMVDKFPYFYNLCFEEHFHGLRKFFNEFEKQKLLCPREDILHNSN